MAPHAGGPACATCREKCRGCDRARPVCGRCATRGLVCKGYPEKFRFCGIATRGKWKGRTAPTTNKSNHSSVSSSKKSTPLKETPPAQQTLTPQSFSGLLAPTDQSTDSQIIFSNPQLGIDHVSPTDVSPTDAQPSQQLLVNDRAVELDDLLMLDRTESLLEYYDHVICPHQIALRQDGPDNPYRLFILPLAYEQIGLLYAILGLTAFHMGLNKKDLYLQETLAVEYRLRAIQSLVYKMQDGIFRDMSENERDGIFATIQILLLQDIFETGISTHGVHITGAISICNQLNLRENLTIDDERAIFFLGNLAWLDAIRSLSDPERLCFSPELRQTIVNLSNVKFELVNGCPRDLFLMMGNALEYSKLYSSRKIDYLRYKQLIEETRFRIYSWQLGDGIYPDVDSRWGFVAEAYRHACIIHTTRLLDEYMPVETPIIQASVTAILDSVSEIPTECYLLELLVLPLFIAGTECLSSHAQHYVLLRLENIRAMAGVGNSLTNALLKYVWDARGNQAKNDHRNIPWMLFTLSEPNNDYLIL